MNEITNNPIKCAQALEALKDVIDPEIGLNVVDLGLIYQIDFDEEKSILFLHLPLNSALWENLLQKPLNGHWKTNFH